MRTLVIDPFHGAAGDMIIGALLPLLSEREEVLQAMASVVAQPSVEIVTRCSITACKVHTHAPSIQRTADEVLAIIQSARVPVEVRKKACNVFERINRAESRVHGYETDPKENNQDHSLHQKHNHEHFHETSQHHFHEVGADDAIADIIGSCMALHLLSPDRVIILPVATGKGTVRIAHGIVPVPAPATAAILHESSLITQFGQEDGELAPS